MNRSWLIWLVLLGCAALILGMFAWVTERALTSEKERAEAEAASLLGERVRLSLSRMDGIGTDLLVSENLRAPMFYRAFFSPSDIVTNQFQDVEQGVVLQPSPLLLEEVEFIDLHFEMNARGHLSSPQVPVGNQRDRASGFGMEDGRIVEMEERLRRLSGLVPKVPAFAALFGGAQEDLLVEADEANRWLSKNVGNIVPSKPEVKEEYQNQLAKSEEASRSKSYTQRVQKAVKKSADWGMTKNLESPQKSNPDSILSVSPFMSLWHGEDLFFVREIRRLRSRSYQGLWVARADLEKALMAEVPLDLGEAALARSDQASESAARLVSLPWALLPGPAPTLEIPALTPLRKTLIAGWVAALFALLALSLLLAGVMKLSERRAAFVSSVTHELRTPLTTFRLYSEMLAEGMVTDEDQRQEYLRTMQSESDRLNHLVENVLSYAQIERGNARSKFEKLAVADLVERMRPVLQRRVDQEDAALSIELSDDLGRVETDVTAVEQILFNLIDNACKYGLPEGEQGHVTLSVRKQGRRVAFEVRDEGRGIARSEKRRLFRAFHKSAHEAAHDKPGVGLGLALCRRLARALGGDLNLGKGEERGASFVLVLR
ncbi:MAG: signal transduction histidine kinase [Paracoccaceae bacterium]|jgi:signal transduction histidine kinase